MSSMDVFKTRDKANDGIKVDLLTPAGEKTDHWIVVRSQLSDAFREAYKGALQEAARVAGLNAPGDDKAGQATVAEVIRARLVDCQAALIASWSFEEPCTLENARQFLVDAPQIADMVDRVAASNARFFGVASTSSAPTPPAT
jgi:hypothetical protein